MHFEPPLIRATLIRRYKRFLADVTLTDGSELTVHCPNTGSMKNCWDKNWPVYLQDSNNPKRKHRYTWVISETPFAERIGVNTHLANKLVEEAIGENRINEISGVKSIQREVKYGEENSRIDLLVETQNKPIYVEVKSVTLKEEDQIGYFPDAVSTRGQKHLRELITIAQSGHARAMLFFCVQHTGIQEVRPAKHIDPEYAKLMKDAIDAGVEIVAYGAQISPEEIKLTRQIKVNNE